MKLYSNLKFFLKHKLRTAEELKSKKISCQHDYEVKILTVNCLHFFSIISQFSVKLGPLSVGFFESIRLFSGVTHHLLRNDIQCANSFYRLN